MLLYTNMKLKKTDACESDRESGVRYERKCHTFISTISCYNSSLSHRIWGGGLEEDLNFLSKLKFNKRTLVVNKPLPFRKCPRWHLR